MRINSIIFSTIGCLTLATPALADCEAYSLSGEAEPKFTDGNITAISATGVSSVVGSNAVGVSTAMKSASLKARGALVRYMSQDVSSTQLAESMSSSETASENGNDTSRQQNTERMAEVIKSQANDILKGATNVGECYDSGRKLAFVKVGVAESLMQALGQFGKNSVSPTAAAKNAGDPANGSLERKSPNAGLFE